MVLKAIASYLQSLPKGFTFSLRSVIPTIVNKLNKRTSVSVISIVNIDALYDYLLFFLLDMPLQSRKSEYFYFCLWYFIYTTPTYPPPLAGRGKGRG
jgi:hypothetical protein